MADQQTIEVKFSLRDEFSRAVGNAFHFIQNEARRFDLSHAHREVQTLSTAFGGLGREMRTVGKITGISALFGGGVVAGLYEVTKGLRDMGREALQLHYQTSGLGVVAEQFTTLRDGMVALGESPAAATGALTTAFQKLQDLQRRGMWSDLARDLARGAHGSGVAISKELIEAVRGPGGLEAGLELYIEHLRKMSPEAQRIAGGFLGLPTSARELNTVLPLLNKRIELSLEQAKRWVLANTNLDISMSNIATTLGTALLPGLTRLVTALDEYLKSDEGAKFTAKLESAVRRIGDALADWVEGGGLDRALDGLDTAVTAFGDAFTAADKVIKACGLSWTQVFIGLMGLGFIGFLGNLAGALAGLVRYVPLMGLILRLGGPIAIAALLYAFADTEALQKKLEEERKRQQGGGFWQALKEMLRGDIGGEVPPIVEQQGRRPITPVPTPPFFPGPAEEHRTRKDVNDELEKMHEELQKLNEYLQPTLGGTGGVGGVGMPSMLGALSGAPGAVGIPATPGRGGGGGAPGSRGPASRVSLPPGGGRDVVTEAGPNADLAEIRAKQADELKDPAVRSALLAYTAAEVGGQGKTAQQAFMEEVFNQAAARKRKIAQILRSDYFPWSTHSKAAGGPTAAQRQAYEPILKDVIGGSNISDFATGNASGAVGFGSGGYETLQSGGERYGVEGKRSDLNFAAEMRRRARERRDRAAKEAKPPPAAPAAPVSDARDKINRSLARDVADSIVKGNANINIDVGASARRHVHASLFRKHKSSSAPQMPNTGGDSAGEWSNFHFE